MMPPRTFSNRSAAGRALAAELVGRGFDEPVVLALPRGGVPVALEVARALHAPLDLVMVRKLGAPKLREFAIGAVADGDAPQIVIDRYSAAMAGATEAYITEAKAGALAEIARRRVLYGADKPPRLSGRTAIIVDDGIATGSTTLAALKAVRAAHSLRVILAIPVASENAIARLEPLCDEVICLHKPRHFQSVGGFYECFDQTTDTEVVAALAKARETLADQQG